MTTPRLTSVVCFIAVLETVHVSDSGTPIYQMSERRISKGKAMPSPFGRIVRSYVAVRADQLACLALVQQNCEDAVTLVVFACFRNIIKEIS